MGINIENIKQTEKENISLNLKKGMSLDLKKKPNLKHLKIGLGWSFGENGTFDLDASAILLNKNKLIENSSSDVIYYNQLDTKKGVYHLGDNRTGSSNEDEDDDEVIMVNIDKIPKDIDEILFIVTIYEAEIKNQNFGMVKNPYIRIVDQDTNTEICKYSLDETFGLQTCVEVAKLKRVDQGFEFVAIGNGTMEDLESILVRYGAR